MAYPSVLARTKDWGSEILTDADLEGQLDLIVTWINAVMNSTTGHKHDATTSEGPKILTANINDAAGTQGDIIINADGSSLGRLAVGTDKQVVASDGTDPGWATLTWEYLPDGAVVQMVNSTESTVQDNDGSTAIPVDDSIPQQTEGDEILTLAITPKATTNKLKIEVNLFASTDQANDPLTVALFQDATAGALAATTHKGTTADCPVNIGLVHYMAAGTAVETTFKVRVGTADTTGSTIGGANGSQLFGGVGNYSITITEIKAS